MTKKSKARKSKETALRTNQSFISDRDMARFALDHLRKTRFPGLRDEDIVKEMEKLSPEEREKIGHEVLANRVAAGVTGAMPLTKSILKS